MLPVLLVKDFAQLYTREIEVVRSFAKSNMREILWNVESSESLYQ